MKRYIEKKLRNLAWNLAWWNPWLPKKTRKWIYWDLAWTKEEKQHIRKHTRKDNT